MKVQTLVQTGLAVIAALNFPLTTASSAQAASFSIDFQDFGSPAPSLIEVNGDAAIKDNILRLTPDAGSQAGSAFFKLPFEIKPDTSFSTRFQFRIHGERAGTTEGADGLTFIIHNDPNGINALSNDGSGLGYGFGGLGGSPISNSLAVAFDTFPFQLNNQGSVELLQNGSIHPLTQSIQPFNFASGNPLNAWVNYNGNQDLLEVFLSENMEKPDSPVLSSTVKLDSVVGAEGFFGFSASTGARFNIHDVENWELAISVPEPSSAFAFLAFSSLGAGSILKRLRK